MQSNKEVYDIITKAGGILYALFDGKERVSQWYFKKSSAMEALKGTSYQLRTNKDV